MIIKKLITHLKCKKEYFFFLTLTCAVILVTGCQRNNLNDRLINGSTNKLVSVAMLLPLESTDASTNELAQNLANAARLASADLKENSIKLSIYPTSGDKIRAVHASRAAVADGAQIIIGPFFGDETLMVKKALLKENIKIISLSNDSSIAGHNLYIFGTTFKTIADRIIRYAMSQNLKRFAIVGPEGNKGLTVIRAIEKSVFENGGLIATVETYPLNFEGIERVAPDIYNSITKNNADAIIFTDTVTRGLGFISELLNNQYLREKRQPSKFLGVTRWDMSRQILREPSLQNGWFVIPDQKFREAFEVRYSNKFGVLPSQISALSYDAIALIGSLIQLARTNQSLDVFATSNFTRNEGFVGVNGVFRFKQDGTNERLLSIAEVDNGSIKIIESAKQSF